MRHIDGSDLVVTRVLAIIKDGVGTARAPFSGINLPSLWIKCLNEEGARLKDPDRKSVV